MSNQENRRPDFRVGKYVETSEPNEIHDLLESHVGPFDRFSKTVPSIPSQEYRPSSTILGSPSFSFHSVTSNFIFQELFAWTPSLLIMRLQNGRLIAVPVVPVLAKN